MDQPIPAADLKQGAVTIDPDNRSVYSGILYQSPRDVLNPPKVQTSTIRFKTPLQKFYATGAEFQHPLSASMGPQTGVRVAKMPTRGKL